MASWLSWSVRAAFSVVALGALVSPGANGGWRAVMPVDGGPVNMLAIDAAGTVYATAASGIFKSSNGGQTWVSASGSLPSLYIQAIAADPVNTATVYVGTNRAIYKTVNGGQDWNALPVPDGTSILNIAVARSNPNYVYATTNGSYFYRSTNGGATWTQSTTGLSGGWSGPSVTTVVAVDPTNALKVYTATWRGQIFQSIDGAATWQAVGGGSTYWLFQLAIAPSAPNVLWAINDAVYTSFANVLKSTDSGATWSSAGQPAGPEEGYAITVDPSNPNVAYVAVTSGLFKTSGGGNWTRVLAPTARLAGVGSVVINPANPLQFYAGSMYFGPYSSSDGGSTWQQRINGFAAASIAGIDLCLASPTTVYATVQTVGLLKSSDGGSTWGAVAEDWGFANESQPQGGVALDPVNPNHVLLSSGPNVWQSNNGGATFAAVSSYSPSWIRFNPLAPTRVHGSIQDSQGGFLFSSTGGGSWAIPQSIYIYPRQYAFHPTFSDVVFAAAEKYTGDSHDSNYVMWSNSGGDGGWQQSSLIGTGTVGEMALDQSDPTVLYVVGTLYSESTQGVYKFNVTYSGTSVSGVSRVAGTFNNGLGTAVPRRIVSNAATSTLYLTTDRGVFRSTDRAATWVPMNTGLPYLSVDAIAVSPDGNHAIVGTNGGIWKFDVTSPIDISTVALPAGTVNAAYLPTTVTATGGTGTYTWTAAGLPPGLGINSTTGTITGTPTTSAGSPFTVTVTATDSTLATGGKNFSLTINPSPALSIIKSHTGSFVQGQSGATYTVTVSNAPLSGPTSGQVTVTETVPTGLTLVSMSGGATWNCAVLPVCTTSAVLNGGSSYPSITVTVNVSGSAPALVTNQVNVSGGGSATASASDATNVVMNYMAGDVAPYTSDTAPNFGNGVLNVLDLVQELFAVNNVPGFRPTACTDRFDAIDLFPADVSTRGGDGVLDIRDLILELFRVNNLDPNRPVRSSRGGVCAGEATARPANQEGTSRNTASARRSRGDVQGMLVLGEPEKSTKAEEERVAVYLDAKHDLVRVAVTFALGDQQSLLRFVTTPDKPPSLAEESQLGVVAVAWMDGITVRAGRRILLGHVAGPRGSLEALKVFGLSASRLDDDREVLLEATVEER